MILSIIQNDVVLQIDCKRQQTFIYCKLSRYINNTIIMRYGFIGLMVKCNTRC